MSRNPHLADAEALFTELGWADADPNAVLDLPLGTPAQRKAALAGLRTGDWSGYVPEEDPYSDLSAEPISWVEETVVGDSRTTVRRTVYWSRFHRVDRVLLVLFAVRLGVGPARAATLIRRWVGWPLFDATAAVLAERGEKFAATFVEHGGGTLPDYAMYLVHRHQLEIPRSVEYLTAWAAFVDRSMTQLPAAMVADRFSEYIRTAVRVGVLSAAVARLASAGVEQRWWDRDDAVTVALQALDVSTRSSERGPWLDTLNRLGFTDAEIVAHVDSLIPLLAVDATAVNRLAPALLAGVDDEHLVDVVTVGLAARTKKARRTVLVGLADRPRPDDATVAALCDLVAEAGTDRILAASARTVLDRWQAHTEALSAEVTGDCWRPTPPVWQVPRFVRGEATVEAVAELAAELSTTPGFVVAVEPFLAMLTALAYTDLDLLRNAIAGVGLARNDGLYAVTLWRDGPPFWWPGRGYTQPTARDAEVGLRLGELPCLLSEPSWEDLRIDPADLTARLEVYAEVGVAASFSDLQLAQARLDLDLLDSATRARWAELAVPVIDGAGRVLPFAAGVADLDHRVEPPLQLHRGVWKTAWDAGHPSLSEFRHTHSHLAVFAAWQNIGRAQVEGAQWHQVVRHRLPLSPAVAVNLLAAAGTPDGAVAVRDAWDRGLLRPGVADVRYLGWTETPTGIAGFAAILGDLARDGLASVAWPVLDDLVVASVTAPKLLAGTVTVVEIMAGLLPEVRHAVTTGAAPVSALDLPGTRALAARGGSSGAVRAAAEVVADLPAPTIVDPSRVERPVVEVTWPDHGLGEPVIDEARLTVGRTGSGALMIYVEIPGDQTYWFRNQVGVGGCTVVPPAAPSNRLWLTWDPEAGRLVLLPRTEVSVVWQDHWLWDSPTSIRMSSTLVTIALAELCPQTVDQRADRLLAVCTSGAFGPAEIQVASRTVLDLGIVEPTALIRVVERNPEALATIWPLLTEPIRLAGTIDGPLPRWVTRALDVALLHAETLRPAVERRLLADASTFPGLARLASRPGKGAVPTRARQLLTTWGLHL